MAGDGAAMDMRPAQRNMSSLALLALAMAAFAGNSLLTRAAMTDPGNDPLSFAIVRILSGAAVLAIFLITKRSVLRWQPAQVVTVLALVGYVLGFSLAYRSVSAATGAFILFSTVQLTMTVVGWLRGDRFRVVQWVGLALALGGFGWLLSPGLSAPPLRASLMMVGAGLSWAVYSLVGAGDRAPVLRTGVNFVGAAVVMAILIPIVGIELTDDGWVLALASGIATSALGYVIWYSVLPHLSRISAATAQLSVPLLAALGGALLLGEALTTGVIVAAALILTGIGMTLRR